MLRITKSAENISALIDMDEDAEVGDNGDSGNDETLEKSPLSKKPNGPTGYLTFLHFEKKMSFLW